MTDVTLKLTGNMAQARAALRVLGLGNEMLARDENGNQFIVTANHHVAVDIWEQPILEFGTYDAEGNELTAPVFADAPYLRIRFISIEAKEKARLKIIEAGGLPAGLEVVAAPPTRIWAGDQV